MAESIFRAKAGSTFTIDSAGIGNWHQGQAPDPRTIKTLARHGIHHFSKARQLRTSDFQEFDHIVVMDEQNYENVCAWPGANLAKASLMMSWVEAPPTLEVPDPYYGSMEDFELVYELLDEATTELLRKLERDLETGVK